MERVFKIEWPDDLGPMWLNQDNLMFCLLSVCKNTPFTVTDVTNKPEESMVEGADPCYLDPLTHDPNAIKEWLAEWERTKAEVDVSSLPDCPFEVYVDYSHCSPKE